jgi:hypothetical protein
LGSSLSAVSIHSKSSLSRTSSELLLLRRSPLDRRSVEVLAIDAIERFLLDMLRRLVVQVSLRGEIDQCLCEVELWR